MRDWITDWFKVLKELFDDGVHSEMTLEEHLTQDPSCKSIVDLVLLNHEHIVPIDSIFLNDKSGFCFI